MTESNNDVQPVEPAEPNPVQVEFTDPNDEPQQPVHEHAFDEDADGEPDFDAEERDEE